MPKKHSSSSSKSASTKQSSATSHLDEESLASYRVSNCFRIFSAIIFYVIGYNQGSIFKLLKEIILKVPSIYLDTLVSIKCTNITLPTRENLDFLGKGC